jgi:hypothetical protein
MAIEVTCQCGRVLKAPEQFAGRRGRCKGCGATLSIPKPGPAPAPAPVEEDWPDFDPAPADDAVVATVIGAIETEAEEEDGDDEPSARGAPLTHAAVKPPPEPWYYGFLVTVAHWTMGIGLAGCAAVGLVGVAEILVAIAPGVEGAPTGSWLRLAVGVGTIALGAASVVPVLLASAPVLLAVDAARNLRSMRYGDRARGPDPGPSA